MVLPVSRTYVWYDKTATDDRVWCVRRPNGAIVRAAQVMFTGVAWSEFLAEGHKDLPSGPRGIIASAEHVVALDSAEVEQ